MTKILKNKRVFAENGGISTADGVRLTTLENNELKITYFTVISGTSGIITPPSQATFNSDEFGLSSNAILSEIDGTGKPTFQSPKTSGGTIVTATLNTTTGAWLASGVYTSTSVALIYSLEIKTIYYSNLNYSNIIESESTHQASGAVSPISYDSATDRYTTIMNTNKLIGRSTAGSGTMEEISIGTGLTLSGGTLNANGATNLGIANKTATTLDITSSTGTSATVPEATITEAGLLNATDKVKLNSTSGTNSGDSASNSTSNTYADGKVIDSIADSDTTHAPSRNAVFDALALKLDTSTAASTYLPIVNPAYTGVLSLGTLTYGPSNPLSTLQKSANSYVQTIIQNTSSGAVASSDLVVNNDVSTDTTFYGDFGMNSSGFTGSGNLNKASAVYLSATSSDLVIGTTTSNPIHFVVNNGATDALTISTTGDATFTGTITGSNLSGTNTGDQTFRAQTIYMSHTSFATPADITSYFFAIPNSNMTTATTVQRRRATAITGFVYSVACHVMVGGTLGTNETGTLKINNKTAGTTTTVLTNLTFTATGQTFTAILGTPFAVTAGDQLECELVTPTWSTNPTTITLNVDINIST